MGTKDKKTCVINTQNRLAKNKSCLHHSFLLLTSRTGKAGQYNTSVTGTQLAIWPSHFLMITSWKWQETWTRCEIIGQIVPDGHTQKELINYWYQTQQCFFKLALQFWNSLGNRCWKQIAGPYFRLPESESLDRRDRSTATIHVHSNVKKSWNLREISGVLQDSSYLVLFIISVSGDIMGTLTAGVHDQFRV